MKKATILKVKHKKYCHRRAYFSFHHCQVFILSCHCRSCFLCHSRAWHGNLKRDVRLKAEHDGKEKEAEHDKEKAPRLRGFSSGFNKSYLFFKIDLPA